MATRRTTRHLTPVPRRGRAAGRRGRSGLWRMALGPGFAVGPTGGVVDYVGRAAQLASEADSDTGSAAEAA